MAELERTIHISWLDDGENTHNKSRLENGREYETWNKNEQQNYNKQFF